MQHTTLAEFHTRAKDLLETQGFSKVYNFLDVSFAYSTGSNITKSINCKIVALNVRGFHVIAEGASPQLAIAEFEHRLLLLQQNEEAANRLILSTNTAQA